MPVEESKQQTLFDCPYCEQKSFLFKALKGHITQKHESTFSCTECSFSSFNYPEIVEHFEKEHPECDMPDYGHDLQQSTDQVCGL